MALEAEWRVNVVRWVGSGRNCLEMRADLADAIPHSGGDWGRSEVLRNTRDEDLDLGNV